MTPSARSTRPHRRWLLLGAALLLAGGGGLILALRAGPSGPPPPPKDAATFSTTAGELRSFPENDIDVAPHASELLAAINDLYERSLLPPFPAPTPDPNATDDADGNPPPSPTPIPREPALGLVDERSAAAFEAAHEAFSAGPGAELADGDIAFTGVMVFDNGQPVGAIVDIEVNATGTLAAADDGQASSGPESSGPELLRLRHAGELYWVRTDNGWRLAGFDVQLSVSRAAAPPPTSPQAAARFVPAHLAWGID